MQDNNKEQALPCYYFYVLSRQSSHAACTLGGSLLFSPLPEMPQSHTLALFTHTLLLPSHTGAEGWFHYRENAMLMGSNSIVVEDYGGRLVFNKTNETFLF